MFLVQHFELISMAIFFDQKLRFFDKLLRTMRIKVVEGAEANGGVYGG